jgi:hypothetical protein
MAFMDILSAAGHSRSTMWSLEMFRLGILKFHQSGTSGSDEPLFRSGINYLAEREQLRRRIAMTEQEQEAFLGLTRGLREELQQEVDRLQVAIEKASQTIAQARLAVIQLSISEDRLYTRAM